MLLGQVEFLQERPDQLTPRTGEVLSAPSTERIAKMSTVLGIDRRPVEGLVAEIGADRELSPARGKRPTAGFPWTDRAVGPGYGTTSDELTDAVKGTTTWVW